MFPKLDTSEETSGNLFAILLNYVEAPLLNLLGFIFYLLSSGTKSVVKLKGLAGRVRKKNFSFPPSPKQRLFGDPFPGLSASSPPSARLPLSRAARAARSAPGTRGASAHLPNAGTAQPPHPLPPPRHQPAARNGGGPKPP